MYDNIKIKIEKLSFDCRISGKEENELIIFLHGFPESSFMWRNLMEEFSSQGYFCVAPNQRGYSQDACPKGKKHYNIKLLSEDVLALADHFGKNSFDLIGHDWGAVVGWKLVHDHPERIKSWSALSVPHIQSFGEAITQDAQQHKMSSYVRAFQWPFLPEMKIRKNDFKLFRRLWKHSRPEEIEDYLNIFRNPRQLTASINYYRSNYRSLKRAFKEPIIGEIKVPTLFIWGNKDPAIGSFSVVNSHRFMKNHYTFVELDAGHWLIQTNYQDLKNEIEKHIYKFRNVTN